MIMTILLKAVCAVVRVRCLSIKKIKIIGHELVAQEYNNNLNNINNDTDNSINLNNNEVL